MPALRADFPILDQTVHGLPLVYFDNGATTQKPQAVLARMQAFYQHENANVHRAVHALSDHATQAYEASRANIADWIGADAEEIVFVRGSTEGLNLFIHGLSQSLQAGDEVIVSVMEHHATLVPWLRLAEQKGIRLRIAPVDDQGCLDLSALAALFNDKTRVLSVMHTSNVLGTVNPIATLSAMAHARGVPILVDGTQALPHQQIDVKAMGCDYYVFSGHKMYGPMGIGVCYAPYGHWQKLPLYHGGGEMIEQVTFDGITYKEPPYCFEAGTPNVAGAVGLSACVDYLRPLDFKAIATHEEALMQRLVAGLKDCRSGLSIYGQDPGKAPIVSFAVQGFHPTDIATLLDTHGIAVRSGHHCAMPLLQSLGESGLLRVSFGMYNTLEEVDYFLEKFEHVLHALQH